MSVFGRIEVQAPYLRCPRDYISHRPFQGLTGLKCPSKSSALQRVLTDFGAEKSFEQASRQLKERYGVELRRSSVREVVLKQAERAAALVDRGDWETIDGSENQRSNRSGEPWLRVESDGSMVRTGELERDQEGGVSLQMGRPKLRRRTRWREVRLSVAEALRGTERQYGPVLGSPQSWTLRISGGMSEGI